MKLSLRGGVHSGPRSPCRDFIAWVRAVLAPIWRKINEYPSEVALGQGKEGYAAVPLLLAVSRGAVARVLQFIVLQQYFFHVFKIEKHQERLWLLLSTCSRATRNQDGGACVWHSTNTDLGPGHVPPAALKQVLSLGSWYRHPQPLISWPQNSGLVALGEIGPSSFLPLPLCRGK